MAAVQAFGAGLALTAGEASAGKGGLPRPVTLVRVSGPITAFAQDAGRIAWSSDEAECPATVHVLTLATRVRIRLPSKAYSTCGNIAPSVLALAGKRALWVEAIELRHKTYGYFVTAALRDRSKRPVCQFYTRGEPTLSAVGDGRTLVFTMDGEPAPDDGRVCSGVWRVDPQGRVSRIARRGSPLLAVGGRRIVLAATADAGGCVCSREPAWSPDGKRIAFSRRPSGRDEIDLVNADGTGERRVGPGSAPDWSPDGNEIAFARTRGDGVSQVVADKADGTGERIVASGSAPQWSPDGSRIAFYRPASEGGFEVVVVNRDGTGAHAILNSDEAPGTPRWSPDSSRIASTVSDVNSGLPEVDVLTRTFVVSADGHDARSVGPGSRRPIDIDWSPDGRRLAIDSESGEILVLNADGSGETKLTGGGDSAPAWSPDGARIAFLRETYLSGGGASATPRWVARLWVMNADGSAQRRLMGGAGLHADPQWSPDGTRIAFGAGELYAVGADGTGQLRLSTTHPAEARSVAEFRSPRSGRLLRTATVAGQARAVALSGSTLAVLVRGFFGSRIALFDARSGRSLGTVGVPPSTASELSAAGANVVFRVGNTIYLLDGNRGRTRILANATTAPIGLSIEGRRVAWVDNDRHGGRIRAVTLVSR